MRTIPVVVLLALAACAALPPWNAADTTPIRAAKTVCAEATQAATPEPACGPGTYAWIEGQPLLGFRPLRNGTPRCSNAEMSTWAGRWSASYQQCLAKAGVTP
jgi:hypothetical protein